MTFPVARPAALSTLALAISSSFSSSFAFANTATEPAMASVVVTAARTPQAAIDVLSDHVLLSSEDIVRSGASTVVDLLQQQRGIEVARNGGPGAYASIFIRGSDSKQNVVLVDGVRIGSSTSGIANWSALPLANIDRIEIIYGPLATMYGADAIGGVVQIFTKKGGAAQRMSAAVEVGSDKARSVEASISGGAQAVNYAFAIARAQDEGISATLPDNWDYNPDNDGYQKDSASGQIGVTLAKGHETGLLFLYSRLNSQFDSGSSSYDAHSVQELQNVALYSSHQISDSWHLKLQASRADDLSENFSSPDAYGINSIDSRQTAFSLQSDLALGADLLQLVLERRDEDVLSSSSAELSTGRRTNSAALSYSLKRGAHLANASTRLDDSSQYGSNRSGGIGYGYRISPSLRANASAGTSFRAPSFNELYYPGYGVASNRPEQGRNIEAGLVFNNGATEASAVYYRNRLTDLLAHSPVCPVDPEGHPWGCAYNVASATLSGLTIGARTTLGSFDLSGSMDFQDPRDDTTGKQLVRRAKRHGQLALAYTAGAINAGIALDMSGKRFDDAANSHALGGYGLLNLFASYRFAPDWSAQVRWNNATNKQYELARNYASAGSQVFVGLRYGER